MHFENMKKTENWLIKVMHSFEVHSNESACRKSGGLGLEQVYILLILSSFGRITQDRAGNTIL